MPTADEWRSQRYGENRLQGTPSSARALLATSPSPAFRRHTLLRSLLLDPVREIVQSLVTLRGTLVSGYGHRESLSCVHAFIECCAGISLRHGEDPMGYAIGKSSSDVISHHQSILRLRQPAQQHGAGERRRIVQVLPPLDDAMYPTKSWHVDTSQLLCG